MKHVVSRAVVDLCVCVSAVIGMACAYLLIGGAFLASICTGSCTEPSLLVQNLLFACAAVYILFVWALVMADKMSRRLCR